jgi:hypothetical protein
VKQGIGPLPAFVLMLGAMSGATQGACAQSAQAQIIDTPPPSSYEEYRRDELEVGARRARNALIGLSVAAGVGAAIGIPGEVRQCSWEPLPGGVEQYSCSRAGRLLVGFGYPLLFGGAIGALASGIVFGVRKKKIRELNEAIARRERAFRWDVRSSRFVF